jgi:CRP-like cAMP-binding protein
VELTLESAFSTGGFVGHFAYLLLIASMLMRTLTALRVLVIASALVAILYAAVWLNDPVSSFWEALLVIVNVVQITREWLRNRQAKFSAEEQKFVSKRLSVLSKGNARRVLNMGVWADGAPGIVLTVQGEPVKHLVYLVAGAVDIKFDGAKVGACMPGNYVGEMSILEGDNASATATVSEPSRYWLISAEQLRKLHLKEPDIAAAFEVGIARDLRRKILNVNKS